MRVFFLRGKERGLTVSLTSITSKKTISRLWWFRSMTTKLLSSSRCWVRSTLQSWLNKTQRSWLRSISKTSFCSTFSQKMHRCCQSMCTIKIHPNILKSWSQRKKLARTKHSCPLSVSSRTNKTSSIRTLKSLLVLLRLFLKKNTKHGLIVFLRHTPDKKKMES